MTQNEPNPYDNIEIMANAVLNMSKAIEQNDFKVNKENLTNFVLMTQMTTNMLKAAVSDAKSKDAVIKGYYELLAQ